MKEVIFLGKRQEPGSPTARWPNAELWGTTHSNVKYKNKRNKHGQVIGTVEDWDAWFELHPFGPVPGYDGIRRRRAGTYAWYQQLPGPSEPGYRPLYLAELDPTIPAGVQFPTRELLAWLRPSLRRWITCQVDAMMAFAIWRGYEHIILHGHGIGREPMHMLDHVGVPVWIEVARERGIEVTIVPPSWYLGQNRPYGLSLRGWDRLHHAPEAYRP